MPIQTRAQAILSLQMQCAPDSYPVLAWEELEALIDAAQLAMPWTASTVYIYGDVVRPSVPNGHLYRCIVAGTSAAIEPTYWPQYTNPDGRVAVTRPHWFGFTGPLPGSQFTDGTVIWLESGFDSGQSYDVQMALYQAWNLKAGKASADYDGTQAGDAMQRSQVVDHCLRMARNYRPTTLC